MLSSEWRNFLSYEKSAAFLRRLFEGLIDPLINIHIIAHGNTTFPRHLLRHFYDIKHDMKYDIVFLHFPVYLLGFSNFRSFKNRFKFLKNFRFKKFSFSDQAAVFHVPFNPLFLADGQTDFFGGSLLCFFQNHAVVIDFFFIAGQA